MTEKCPTCESPSKQLHPALQADGGEVHLCQDPWHGPLDPRMRASSVRPETAPAQKG